MKKIIKKLTGYTVHNPLYSAVTQAEDRLLSVILIGWMVTIMWLGILTAKIW